MDIIPGKSQNIKKTSIVYHLNAFKKGILIQNELDEYQDIGELFGDDNKNKLLHILKKIIEENKEELGV